MKKFKTPVYRFKRSTGKYYDQFDFHTDCDLIFDIADEIRQAVRERKLPDEYFYMITGEGIPNGHPRLIL